jgi:uncharacterized surface protein with fasciclin (FAS1) repeats
MLSVCRLRRAMAAAATVLLLSACGGERPAPGASALDSTSLLTQDTTLDASLAEVLRRRERFRVFSTMLDSAGLLSRLRRGGSYTVFAPTDPCIQKLPEGVVEELLLPANRERLRQIVGYHLHRGRIARDSLLGMDSISTIAGSALPVATEGGRVLVGNERMSEYAITTRNGRIFALDVPVMPPPDAATRTLPDGGTYDTLGADDDTGNSNGNGDGGNGAGRDDTGGSDGGNDEG